MRSKSKTKFELEKPETYLQKNMPSQTKGDRQELLLEQLSMDQ